MNDNLTPKNTQNIDKVLSNKLVTGHRMGPRVEEDPQEDSIGQEIKIWIKESYKSFTEFSDVSGIPYPTLQNWFMGKRLPSYTAIKKLIGYGFVPDIGLDVRDKLDESKRFESPEEVSSMKIRTIPLLDVRASAGTGQPVYSEYIEDHYPFNEQWLAKRGLSNATLSVIHITGNSMEPLFSHDDEVLVHHNAPLVHGKVSVFLHEGELYIKRMEMDRTGWVAVSENEAYAPIKMTEDSVLIGRAENAMITL